MSSCAYPLSYTSDTSQKVGGIFRTLGKKVRERFSRTSKPIDHLGGLDPEGRFPSTVQYAEFSHSFNDNRPKTGASHEDMEIRVG